MKETRDWLPWLAGVATFAIPAAVLWGLPIPRVYSNEYGELWPMIGFVTFAVVAGFLISQRSRAALLPVLANAAILVLSVRWLDKTRMGDRASSCANHAGQWNWMVRNWLESHDRMPDGYAELIPASERGHPESLYCPGRADTTFESGYVYVGDGLRCDLVKKKEPLLIFCAVGSHPFDNHAYERAGTTCVRHDELVELLRTAIRQGEQGEVPYSPRALNLMRTELSARQTAR